MTPDAPQLDVLEAAVRKPTDDARIDRYDGRVAQVRALQMLTEADAERAFNFVLETFGDGYDGRKAIFVVAETAGRVDFYARMRDMAEENSEPSGRAQRLAKIAESAASVDVAFALDTLEQIGPGAEKLVANSLGRIAAKHGRADLAAKLAEMTETRRERENEEKESIARAGREEDYALLAFHLLRVKSMPEGHGKGALLDRIANAVQEAATHR